MIRLFRRNKKPPVDHTNHPAYKAGYRFGLWLLRQELRLADAINDWQCRISPRLRNAILLTIFLAFASYFIWTYLQTR